MSCLWVKFYADNANNIYEKKQFLCTYAIQAYINVDDGKANNKTRIGIMLIKPLIKIGKNF